MLQPPKPRYVLHHCHWCMVFLIQVLIEGMRWEIKRIQPERETIAEEEEEDDDDDNTLDNI